MSALPLGTPSWATIPDIQMPQRQLDIPAYEPKQRGGMFGGAGKFLKNFVINMSASQGNPMAQAYLQQMHQRKLMQQRQAQEEAQYQRQRTDGMADWMAKQDYQRANPSPVNNDTVADYNFWKSTLSPEEFEVWKQNKINPPQLMNIPGVGVVQVPRMGGGGAAAPSKPLTDAEIDALEGGNGGQSQPGSGSFL